MSMAGLKKQFNKANQFMNEKMMGVKGTELDDDYLEMEKRVDEIAKLTDSLLLNTQEYLQPNPASRAKLMTINTVAKVRGQAPTKLYPQPEGTLGEGMIKHGRNLDTAFGESLMETGEAFKQLSEMKYSLEDTVKQNFLEPLEFLKNKDMKEVNHHRKKTESRRLDYDCKKRKKEKSSNISDEELRIAEEKFEESKELAETAMFNLLDNEVEQISQLSSFVEAIVDYHRQALDILQQAQSRLEEKRSEAARKPRESHQPKRVLSKLSSGSDSSFPTTATTNHSNARTTWDAPPAQPSYTASVSTKPCCKALYDFEPENAGELGFKEGEIITLLQKVDENWFEGTIHGKKGFFPINYVDVVVPL